VLLLVFCIVLGTRKAVHSATEHRWQQMCNNVDSEVENKLYSIYRDLIYKIDTLKSMKMNRTGTTRLMETVRLTDELRVYQ
jgi:hypothetical protein